MRIIFLEMVRILGPGIVTSEEQRKRLLSRGEILASGTPETFRGQRPLQSDFGTCKIGNLGFRFGVRYVWPSFCATKAIEFRGNESYYSLQQVTASCFVSLFISRTLATTLLAHISVSRARSTEEALLRHRPEILRNFQTTNHGMSETSFGTAKVGTATGLPVIPPIQDASGTEPSMANSSQHQHYLSARR